MMNLKKAGRENWVADDSAKNCRNCTVKFDMTTRKHHCRACGNIFCWKCSSKEISYTPYARVDEEGYTEKKKRVCEACYNYYTKVRAQEEQAKEEGDAAKKQALAQASHLLNPKSSNLGDKFAVTAFNYLCAEKGLSSDLRTQENKKVDVASLGKKARHGRPGGRKWSQAEKEAVLLDMQFDLAIQKRDEWATGAERQALTKARQVPVRKLSDKEKEESEHLSAAQTQEKEAARQALIAQKELEMLQAKAEAEESKHKYERKLLEFAESEKRAAKMIAATRVW